MIEAKGETQGHNFDLKEEIRAYWSDRAANFDESASHLIENGHGVPQWHRLLREAFDLADDQSLDGKKVLDIACGTGEISRVLCGLGAEVTGLDFSETMHLKARKKLASQNWHPLACDAESLLGVPDAQFDFAVTRHLVWTLTDPQAAFGEWARVLKPGGRLLIVDGNWIKRRSLMQSIRQKIADFLEPAVPRSDEDMERNQNIRQRLPYRDGLNSERLKADLSLAGFDYFDDLSVKALYSSGMRAWPLATRLRQNSVNRFALVCLRHSDE